MTIGDIEKGNRKVDVGEVVGAGGPKNKLKRATSNNVVFSVSAPLIFNDTAYKITPTMSSVRVLQYNKSRRYLLIQNNGASGIIVSFGKSAFRNDGINIPSGGFYEPFYCPVNSVNVKTEMGAVSAADVIIVEGYF